MISFKQRISCKAIALVMVLLMVVSMIPVTLIAYALDSANESPYKAQNFTAVYNAETDSVDMTWDEFTTEPYELWLCVDTLKTTQLDVAATKYSYSVVAGGEKTYSLLAFVDDADVEGVESDRIGVTSADTLTSISSFDAVEAENNLTITEIIAKLPTKAKVATDTFSTPTEYGNSVQWNAEGTGYDQSKSEEQTITISGVVKLDNEKVQNRNNISLDCSVEVNVKAAVDVAISSNLDDSAPIEKKVGESLALTVEATGTAPKYQWYKKTAEETEGTAIDGATSATFTINSVALTDAAQYYCVIIGKNKSTVTSKIATVNVAKNDVDLQLSISPSAGQTRPNPIEIEVLNVPTDAKGTVTIKQGADEIYNVDLDGSNGVIKYTFTATGLSDNFVFSAYYTGDDEKYNADEVTGVAYDFTKGTQNKPTISGVRSDVKALDTFTVTASGVNTANGKYTFSVSNPAIAEITESTDNKATIKVLKKGEFTITAIANANDDYNASEPTTQTVEVEYAVNFGLEFDSTNDEQVYTSNFSYEMGYSDTSEGKTEPVFSIDWSETTAQGVAIDSATGRIFYTDDANSFKTDFAGTVGTVKVVATKATDGVYDTVSDDYTLVIKKGTQASLGFSTSAHTVTYTERDVVNGKTGTMYTHSMSDTQKGTVNSVLSYAITSQKTLENANTTGVAEINSTTGEITALKSGVVEITATLPGNNMYEDATCSYTLSINRGEIATSENGIGDETVFNFDSPDSEIKYGFIGFSNIAKGGQTDVTSEVVYTDNSDEITVSDNGVITFDKTPDKAVTETYTATITATKPQTDKYNKCSVSYTLTVTRDAVNPATDFRVNGDVIKDANKLTSHDGWYNAEHAKITITPSGNYTQISENGTEWKASLERTSDDKHAIAFYLKDADGNTSLVSNQTVNYDTKVASAKLTVANDNNFWESFLETITFGLWKKEGKQVLIEAEDNLSGIMSIEYYEQNSNFQDVTDGASIEDVVKDFEWKTCTIDRDGVQASGVISVELEELTNKKAVVYAKVTDYAGNVSYFRTDGMIFDNVTPKQETTLPDPIIEIKLDKNTSEGLYNSDVPFTLTVNDDQTDSVASGIKDITVTIKGSEDEEYEKTIKITANKSEINSFDSANIDSDEFTVDGTFVVPADFDSNYLTILVEAEDYAGNIYTNENEITRLAIDNTKPVIEVSYEDDENTFSNKRYIGNNKNRVANIHITELNFDKSAVVINVTKDGKKVDIKPNFKKANGEVDENGDQIGWDMSINYATLGEGDFTFDITYTDKAENPNDGWKGDNISVNKKFTIDNTKPIIDVVITNKEVQNGKYFSSNRKAIVTIVERNFSKNYKFDWSGITLELDGKTLTPPTPKLTGNNKNTYVREYEVEFTAEGDYTFGVKYTDLADNLADKYSCSSVAYEEFTIDKTDPELEITGVANNSANKGDVAPVVKYSDINFDEDNVEIRLTGAKNTSPKVSGKYTAKDKQGHTYKYNNFEKVQDLDDIYTLHAELTDKAGNSTEKTITFSVNRFGSVYNLSMIKQNISRYLSEEKDIVFTETNVDALDRKNIRLKLIKNGTPIDLVEGTDYTIEESGGNGKAYVYKYIIKKSLFANDGKYSIVVYSKDAAGNINENDDETKKAEISFGIDKTKPVVVPIDFESGVQYAVDKKVVSIDIKDNLVLEDVKIYLNDKEVTDVKVDGENYTFEVAKSNAKQTVKIVAVDAAENEQVIEIADFLVNANIFVRWFNNTPLFIGTIIGFVVLILGSVAFVLFGKKRKQEK